MNCHIYESDSQTIATNFGPKCWFCSSVYSEEQPKNRKASAYWRVCCIKTASHVMILPNAKIRMKNHIDISSVPRRLLLGILKPKTLEIYWFLSAHTKHNGGIVLFCGQMDLKLGNFEQIFSLFCADFGLCIRTMKYYLVTLSIFLVHYWSSLGPYVHILAFGLKLCSYKIASICTIFSK